MRADTKRKENSMKNIATNFQEHRVPRSDFSLKLLLLLLALWLALVGLLAVLVGWRG